jgi:hypothetical protein
VTSGDDEPVQRHPFHNPAHLRVLQNLPF